MNDRKVLSDYVLYDCQNDWLELGAVDGAARLLGCSDPEARKALVLDVLADLEDRALVEVGDLSRTHGFRSWNLAPRAAIARIAEIYRPGAENDWAFHVWLNITPKGRLLAGTLTDDPMTEFYDDGE